jgi:hypothetical protein
VVTGALISVRSKVAAPEVTRERLKSAIALRTKDGVRGAKTGKTDTAACGRAGTATTRGIAAVAADGAVDDSQRASAKPQIENAAAANAISIGC